MMERKSHAIQYVMRSQSHVILIYDKERIYMSKTKGPQPNAVSKMREAYNEIRNRPLTPEQKKELVEVFQKKNKTSNKAPKKIARPKLDAEM